MRALTLWQPWASLVAEGIKTLETRSWPAPPALVGERIAIHAAARKPPSCDRCSGSGAGPGTASGAFVPCEWCGGDGRHPLCAEVVRMPLGAVVATARLDACIPMEDLDAPLDEVEGTIEHGRVLYIRPRVDPFDFALDARRHEHPPVDVDRSDQLPFGEFAQGRWAWLLEDVVSLPAPIPARGGQRIWRWAGAA